MIAFLRRIFSTALTPVADEPQDTVPVRAHVRKKPVNHKREALHDALRRAVAG